MEYLFQNLSALMQKLYYYIIATELPLKHEYENCKM